MLRKIRPLFFMGFLLAVSCTEDLMFFPMEEKVEVANNSPEYVAVKNYILKKHPVQSRHGCVDIEPYVLKVDTVLFVANYGEEQGWEVFSNALSTPMVLIKSPKGQFNPSERIPNHPVYDVFGETAEKVWEIKNTDNFSNDTINSEWKLYNHELNSISEGVSITSLESNDDGYQFLISTEPVVTNTVIEPKGGRLVTQWDQDSYYNMYTPFYSDKTDAHTLVGCVAVAFGQFFYHSHYNFGLPVYAVTEAKYNSSNNTYSFSGASSTIWDSFNSYPDMRYYPEYMSPTAIFLGYIGKCINTAYGVNYYNKVDDKNVPDGSYAQTLATSTIDFFKKETSLNVEITSVEPKYVVSVLEKGYPVVARASKFELNSGHAFLIDHYESEVTKYYNYYTNKVIPPDAEWPDLYDGISLEELENMFGEIIIEEEISSKSYYKMNWGWGGADNNVSFDTWCISFVTQNGSYARSSAQMYNIK